MEFMLGCNYWASNAGAEMWKNWEPKVVEKDLKILAEHGVTHLRVFPNWRDFQPVVPIISAGNVISEYRLEDENFDCNPYYLSEKMLAEFDDFCDMCDKYSLKLVVGLLTGWMSGRTYVPSVLAGKNLFTDTTALLFEQKFIKGFLERFKNRSCICAWDLGNECNCMSRAQNREIAENWTSIISNTIRANDNTRPIISGMHGLGFGNDTWTIADQGKYTDILTTHPYPLWVQHADKDRVTTYRTTMHATSQNKLYSDIGGKPCLMEEIGTMGPMVCSDENAAKFFKCNLYSSYINGAVGIMWWCANEQVRLTTVPYTTNMCEVELGMIYADGTPKPVLKELKDFSETIKKINIKLPQPEDDAVCILTKGQDQGGIAYMAYCLAKQVGINLKFVYANQKLPDAKVYMLPSINGVHVMPKENYEKLREKVAHGAKLYISNNDGFLSEFRSLTGLKIVDSSKGFEGGSVNFGEEIIEFSRNKTFQLESDGAEIIATGENKTPEIAKNKFGKGEVFYVNFPLENMLLNESNAFDKNCYKIYENFFESEIKSKAVVTKNPKIALTLHNANDKTYCAVINHSDQEQKLDLIFNGKTLDQIILGDGEVLKPFETAIFTIK